MNALQIGLATCSKLPEWEVDDHPLHAALEERGVEVLHPVWDDPAVDWSSLDACLIRTTWDYDHRRDAFVHWAEELANMTACFNPAHIIRWNTHKSYLQDLEQAGIATIPTVWLEAGCHADLKSILDERNWSRGFIKPVIGSTARATFRFHHEQLNTAQDHLDTHLAREDMMVQPYLERVETGGEESIMLIDGKVTHAVRKVPVPGDYRVQDDFGARDEGIQTAHEDIEQAEQIMALAAAGTRWHGGPDNGPLLYGRIDFLRDQDGHALLNELELVEPSFFFRHEPAAAIRMAEALMQRLT